MTYPKIDGPNGIKQNNMNILLGHDRQKRGHDYGYSSSYSNNYGSSYGGYSGKQVGKWSGIGDLIVLAVIGIVMT